LSKVIVKGPSDFIIGKTVGFRYEDICVRRELQTAIRLPKSQAILFTVKTFVDPLTSLTDEELLVLDAKLSGMDKTYHNLHSLGPVLKSYIKNIRKI
jgi:hypothetical protein